LYWHRPIASFPVVIILRFLFIFSLCVAFDVRDLESDAAAGIFTLPYRLGVRRADGLMHAALFLFAVLAIVQYVRYPNAARLIGEWGAALFAYWSIHYVRRRPSDFGYLLWVDGSMLVYGGVLILIT
jgi:1,4-dihydroxy-2-naphthoate octaprenyltransferase